MLDTRGYNTLLFFCCEAPWVSTRKHTLPTGTRHSTFLAWWAKTDHAKKASGSQANIPKHVKQMEIICLVFVYPFSVVRCETTNIHCCPWSYLLQRVQFLLWLCTCPAIEHLVVCVRHYKLTTFGHEESAGWRGQGKSQVRSTARLQEVVSLLKIILKDPFIVDIDSNWHYHPQWIDL